MKNNSKYPIMEACAISTRYQLLRRKKDRWLAREYISKAELYIKDRRAEINYELEKLTQMEIALFKTKQAICKCDIRKDR